MRIFSVAVLNVALALLPAVVLAKHIRIEQVSDLDFGVSVAGDPPKTIPAGQSESPQNASFEVTGKSNQSYTILLPPFALLSAGWGPSSQMYLRSFTSFPECGQGLLNHRGEQMVYVGATRNALSSNQRAGLYSGTFLITVVY